MVYSPTSSTMSRARLNILTTHCASRGRTPRQQRLRARIALEEGNPSFALRLVEEQIRLRPDHSGLRELHASTLFMLRNYAEARSALEAARRLGAAEARVAYNLGLISEEEGDTGWRDGPVSAGTRACANHVQGEKPTARAGAGRSRDSWAGSR